MLSMAPRAAAPVAKQRRVRIAPHVCPCLVTSTSLCQKLSFAGASKLNTAEARTWTETASLSLKIFSLNDWYRVRLKDVNKIRPQALGRTLSLTDLKSLLRTAYPSHPWEDSKWRGKKSFWSSIEQQRAAFDKAMQENGLIELSDWYKYSSKALYKWGLGGLLVSYYKGSLVSALRTMYPEHHWLPWRFVLFRNFWTRVENRREFLESAGAELGVATLDDWYSVSRESLLALDGGEKILRRYHHSLPKALSDTFAEHEWHPWLFKTSPRLLFDDFAQRRRYMEWLGSRVGVAQREDWYQITREAFEKNNGAGFLAHCFTNSPKRAVMETFVEHSWDTTKFQTSKG